MIIIVSCAPILLSKQSLGASDRSEHSSPTFSPLLYSLLAL